jgi:hypothetical protein
MSLHLTLLILPAAPHLERNVEEKTGVEIVGKDGAKDAKDVMMMIRMIVLEERIGGSHLQD